MKKLTTKDLCLIGIFAGIIAVMAQIIVPLPGVPVTMQTFAIPLAGIVLGAKRGTIAVFIYVLLGAVGLPVFAGFSGGIGHIAGPTGGFILSFPIMAFTTGYGAEKGSRPWLAGGIILGMAINYMCGMLYFSHVLSTDLQAAFTIAVLRFIPADILKAFMAVILGLRLEYYINRVNSQAS